MFCFFVFTLFRARFDRSSEFVQETSGINGKNKGNMYVKHTDTFFGKTAKLIAEEKVFKGIWAKMTDVCLKKDFSCLIAFSLWCCV